MTRPHTSRCRIAPTIAVLAATSRKLVSHTPPSEAEAIVAGWFHWDAPSNAHGPPRLCQDRTASAITHALGNTIHRGKCAAGCDRGPTAAGARPTPTATTTRPVRRPAPSAADQCSAAASTGWSAHTRPDPTHARTALSRAVGAARTTSSSGTRASQANHHHDGAGKKARAARRGPVLPHGRRHALGPVPNRMAAA